MKYIEIQYYEISWNAWTKQNANVFGALAAIETIEMSHTTRMSHDSNVHFAKLSINFLRLLRSDDQTSRTCKSSCRINMWKLNSQIWGQKIHRTVQFGVVVNRVRTNHLYLVPPRDSVTIWVWMMQWMPKNLHARNKHRWMRWKVLCTQWRLSQKDFHSIRDQR